MNVEHRERCAHCKIEQDKDAFYMYSEVTMTKNRIQKSYLCKPCSDRTNGDKWYTITGYDQECDISDRGCVRELREGKYFDITTIQNASISYVYLSKNGKIMKKNIRSLMKRFVKKEEEIK